MIKYIRLIVLAVLLVFGTLTLLLSSSVIFDWFGIRAKESNYVNFVVWANFLSSLLYASAAYGLYRQAAWVPRILFVTAFVLLAASFGLWVYASNGGQYETKTVYAMAFRTVFTLVLGEVTVFLNKTSKT